MARFQFNRFPINRFQLDLPSLIDLRTFPAARALNWAAGFGAVGLAAVASWTCVNLLAPPPAMKPILSEAEQVSFAAPPEQPSLAKPAKAAIADHTVRGQKATYDASQTAEGEPISVKDDGIARKADQP